MGKFIGVILLSVIGIIVFAALFALFAGLPTYLLWNWLMPTLFGIKTITFLQALGIVFLSALLFKGGGSSSSK